MSLKQLLDRIRRIPGTQKEVAAALGVSPQYLGDVLALKADPGPKILDALGYERVVSFRRKA